MYDIRYNVELDSIIQYAGDEIIMSTPRNDEVRQELIELSEIREMYFGFPIDTVSDGDSE